MLSSFCVLQTCSIRLRKTSSLNEKISGNVVIMYQRVSYVLPQLEKELSPHQCCLEHICRYTSGDVPTNLRRIHTSFTSQIY